MKPWYNLVVPREDLRENKPLDASEFAVHLDHVRDGRAPPVYQSPVEFFRRTFLTDNIVLLASQVLRRLSGLKVETSAVFNLSTQFGGGKTHSLTLLYHLARGGSDRSDWEGVPQIMAAADLATLPNARTAVFVGTEFDSISGRGAEGEPLRKTPWGEIAFQLGGEGAFREVAQHDEQLTAPGGDVIEKMLPNEPTLILLDELMNYVSRSRKSGLASQLYTFLHNLSEVARGRSNIVLAVSLPASELEMTAEDQSDFERLKKLLDRLGKPIVMSAEAETSEIIRRRLFEWNGLPAEAQVTIAEHVDWIEKHADQLPSWFPASKAGSTFAATYPFHPSVLSVFERKWQTLPRFQQTRGVLRLLALWVAHAYANGYKGAHKDPVIGLGTAPLEDPLFRAALFEQLGENRLETAVTTDIAGKDQAHAARLDAEGAPDQREARLDQQIATSILFESNGGQLRGDATLPEVRLAVGAPGVSLGAVEQALEALVDASYYISAEFNRYRFSFQPNLNKLLADRRASVTYPAIEDRLKAEIQTVFSRGSTFERVFFPRKSGDIPDRPQLTLAILEPRLDAGEPQSASFIKQAGQEYGTSSRAYKSALIWCVADDEAAMAEEARRLLAWREIEAESYELKLDEARQAQLTQNISRSERDLREAVWRTYKHIYFLDEQSNVQHLDLGLVNSSIALSMPELIATRLRQEEIVVDAVSFNLLRRLWPPALPEWNTRAVRDSFFASPKFPRLSRAEALKETIAGGVAAGAFAYVVKREDGAEPEITLGSPLEDVELADYVFLVKPDDLPKRRSDMTEGEKEEPALPGLPAQEPDGANPVSPPVVVPGTTSVVRLRWSGELRPDQWMQFYSRVINKYQSNGSPSILIEFSATAASAGSLPQELAQLNSALAELGLNANASEVDDKQ